MLIQFPFPDPLNRSRNKTDGKYKSEDWIRFSFIRPVHEGIRRVTDCQHIVFS